MNSTSYALPLLLAYACSPGWAGGRDFLRISDTQRSETRRAVETHRESQREEVQREEQAAGRRLTPAELAELRNQVRQQWSPQSDGASVGKASGPVDHGPAPTKASTMPRSHRP
ncbi:hypothetical protein ACSFA3_03270 [Variovorax sp. RHLX14]|uniref:hypothetical protein n=1 Tax=Variovorax sp. RHLX14 TaxID=1259731 RepID=UPI003F470847